ncbi:hypothetical protein CEXT_296891 [Caerostris extrusa]|uniref:Uncharacterized protein n=1 Tax=Caerostris extrusa TaxID=172846 RepID=A0AAV4TUN6_CAEEX|nr:hypothetical protein CEXT_296891 [Caerostris extrusa]
MSFYSEVALINGSLLRKGCKLPFQTAAVGTSITLIQRSGGVNMLVRETFNFFPYLKKRKQGAPRRMKEGFFLSARENVLLSGSAIFITLYKHAFREGEGFTNY